MHSLSVDIAIIGAGTAGLGAYRAASKHTSSIVLIEGGSHGTTCARVGCMPSKLLIAAAEAAHHVASAPVFGVHPPGPARIDGREVMARVRSERDRFVGFVLESVGSFPAEHKLAGHARFLDDHSLQVDDHTIIEARRIVIATGSRSTHPPQFDAVGDLLVTNDDIFSWDDLPASAVVFGGGAIGLELGQALHRLGVRIQLLGRGGGVGPISDPAILDYARNTFAAEFDFDPDADVKSVERRGMQVAATFVRNGRTVDESFDVLIAATGRRPNVDNLSLEATSLELGERGTPLFNRFTGQCGSSHIFIAGDANNDVPLLHEAADEGRIAGANAASWPEIRSQMRRAGLGIVFSDPQIATAGLSWREVQFRGLDVATGEVSFEDQGRSRVMNINKGLMRLWAAQGTGLFLGAEMIGPRAEHLAHLLAWSAQQGLSVSEMLDMPYYHPVIEEGLRSGLRDLNRNLHIGPALVPHCLDCGPGA